MTLHFLVVASETPRQRDERRAQVGAASDETYRETLSDIEPGCVTAAMSCVDGSPVPSIAELRRYDAVFFAGSPIQMHGRTAEASAAVAFMRAVFEAGVPAFGSCAGLQIAAVAAGGAARKRQPRMEAAFTRAVVATEAGSRHPLLRGRPLTWDAPAMHSDVVDSLPETAIVLARSRNTPIQAAEIRYGNGVFWGVQYHPELTLAEIAASLRRQSKDLVEEGLAVDESDVEAFAGRIDALDREPDRRDLAWQLGLDQEVTDPKRRTIELRNFIEFLVRPAARDRRASETPRMPTTEEVS